MIKVLIANQNVEQSEACCQYLANDKNLEIIKTYDGNSTLKKYTDINPNIFILDASFSDINGIEIIDRLSMSINEKKNCNTIVTTNSVEEQLKLVHTSKIYQIVPKPYELEFLRQIIYNMCFENKYEQIERDDIQILLLKLGVSLGSDGCDYLIDAIILCYYFPYYLKSLDSVLNHIAIQRNKESETIRNGIRSVLKVLNLYTNITPLRHPLLKLFADSKGVTPKRFIEVIVTYFHRKKNKK